MVRKRKISEVTPSQKRQKLSTVEEYAERVEELETENVSLKAQIKDLEKQLKKKKPKLKKLDTYFKDYVKKLVKAGNTKKNKFLCMSREFVIKVDRFSFEEFKHVFQGKGDVKQPRPDFKPKTKVHISRFSDKEAMDALFEGAEVPEKITVHTYSSGSFRKTRYCGTTEATVDNLEVHYNQSLQKLQLKFDCSRDYSGWGW